MTGPFVYCLATQAHGHLPDDISPQLYADFGRVMQYTRGQLTIPMGHMFYSDLLEINKNNMNEGHFLMPQLIKRIRM